MDYARIEKLVEEYDFICSSLLSKVSQIKQALNTEINCYNLLEDTDDLPSDLVDLDAIKSVFEAHEYSVRKDFTTLYDSYSFLSHHRPKSLKFISELFNSKYFNK